MTPIAGPPPAVRLDSLTSLRWVAASLVFLSHARELLIGHGTWFDRIAIQGSSGVSFFFVLSGFVLMWSYRPGIPNAVFYGRRFARIYPAYVLVAVVSVPMVYLFGELHSPLHWAEAVFPVTLLQAWVPHYRITYGGNGVSWSLSCEAFFYGVFPFVVSIVARASRRSQLSLMGVAVMVPFVLGVALNPSADQSAKYLLLYANPIARIPEFAVGMVLGALLRSGWRIPALTVGRAASLATAAYVSAGWAPLAYRTIALTLVPFTLLIFATAQADIDGRAPKILTSRWLMTLGTWSYCFYLVHQMVLRGLAQIDDIGRGTGIALSVVGYVLAIGVSAALYHLVEHPMERRLRPRADALASGRAIGAGSA